MKSLILILLFAPTLALADSMFGLDVGAGPGARPSYGFDYERYIPDGIYGDFMLTGNQDFIQPYGSAGIQFEHLNVGLGVALTASDIHQATFHGAFTAGPELGYMYNLTKTLYVKENNTYLSDMNGTFHYGATLSLGINF